MKLHIPSLIFIFAYAVTLQIQESHQVIIIGAGISGLRASQILAEQNIPHIILQSTDHVGGRITSMQFQGLKVDKGASFIHNSKKNNSLAKLVEDLGWPIIDGTCSYQVMFDQGQKKGPIPQESIKQARKMYFQLVDIVQTRLQKSKDVSVAEATKGLFEKEYPKQSQLSKRLVDFMFNIQGNVDGAQVSALSAKMRSYNESRNDIMPSSGFHKFFDVVFHFIGGKVLFNQRVHTIDYSSDIVKVITEKQVFYAKKVISSLPLGVLKAEKVKFNPSLPAIYKQSINNIGSGYADKLFVSFQKPFWGNKTGWLSFVTKTQQNKYPVAFIIPSQDKHILIFFVSGDASLKISKWTDYHILNDLQDFLITFFRICQVEIKTVKLTRWHMDQNALGSYSNYKVGTTQQDFIELSKPLGQKIWFIGQHTHPKLNSYAHGAYLTGEVAAKEVITSLKLEKKSESQLQIKNASKKAEPKGKQPSK